MTLIFEIFALFSAIFFHKALKNFLHVKYYHFKYLGGALCIALYARKKLCSCEVSIKSYLQKRLGWGKSGDFYTVFAPPLVVRVTCKYLQRGGISEDFSADF